MLTDNELLTLSKFDIDTFYRPVGVESLYAETFEKLELVSKYGIQKYNGVTLRSYILTENGKDLLRFNKKRLLFIKIKRRFQLNIV